MEDLFDKAVTNNKICKICLSTDRTLTPLGKYLELFKKICPKLKSSYKTTDLICWECQALLEKVERFQLKVLKAQNFFKNVYRSLDKSQQVENQVNPNLSTLQTVINSEINYYFDALNPEIEKPKEVINYDVKIELDTDNANTDQFYDNDAIFNEVGKVEDIKNEKIDLNQVFLNKIGHFLGDNLNDENYDDITDFKDELDNGDYEYLPDTKKKKKKKARSFKKKHDVKKVRRPYRVVYGEKGSTHGTYTSDLIKKVTIDKEELLALMEKERTMDHFLKWDFKCEKCVIGYLNESTYLQHMKNHETDKGRHKCHICQQRFTGKQYLEHHSESHLYKFECGMCAATYLKKYNIWQHVRREHERAYECVDCGGRHKTKSELLEHYKSHKEFVCDHCGKKSSKKDVMERHMIVEHLPHVCKICNITFRKHRILHGHNMLKHFKTRAEEAFCVECNLQFDNVTTFKRHIATSVKHRPKSDVKYPCPECNKLFNKKMSMKYHYAYFHTDRTKFYCVECAKYFLNNYQLRRHKSVFHLKIKPPKNKFCPHCGRGFSERRVLENHIRTHTGERPFVCTICSAAFTQSYPLTTHMRSVHKITGKFSVHSFAAPVMAPPSSSDV